MFIDENGGGSGVRLKKVAEAEAVGTAATSLLRNEPNLLCRKEGGGRSFPDAALFRSCLV
jgi:hypothetical protein